MRITALASAVLVLVLAIVSGPAAAGVALEFEQTTSAGATGKIEVWIDGHDLAARTVEGDLVFLGEKQLMWLAEPTKGHYFEFTADAMRTVVAEMNEAVVMMREQLAAMPAEQRGMVENMMRQQGGPAAAMLVDERVESLGTKEIDGHPCFGYEVYSGDVLTMTAWTTDMAEFGLGRDEVSAIRDLETFMGPDESPIKQMLGRYLQDITTAPSADRLSGLPVHIEQTGIDTIHLVSVRNSEVPDGVFDEPKGLEKKTVSNIRDFGG